MVDVLKRGNELRPMKFREFAEVRKYPGRVVEDANNDGPQGVIRQGEVVAVIFSMTEYQNLLAIHGLAAGDDLQSKSLRA